jgi:hypothetical protein
MPGRTFEFVLPKLTCKRAHRSGAEDRLSGSAIVGSMIEISALHRLPLFHVRRGPDDRNVDLLAGSARKRLRSYMGVERGDCREYDGYMHAGNRACVRLAPLTTACGTAGLNFRLPVMQPGTKHGGNLSKTLQALDLLREERDLRNRQLAIPLPQLTQMLLLLCGLLHEEG